MVGTKYQGKTSVHILAMDTGWIAVDKPCGMSVHNEPGRDLCSVLRSKIEAEPKLNNELKYDSDFGVNAPHRLDKDTSGVILLACNQDVFRYFSKQFESRDVQKKYIALLHGTIMPGADNGIVLWDRPLSKIPGGRNRPNTKGETQPSLSHIRIDGHSKHYTLVECSPMTGRKHQIRRHAKLAGHPVVGDRRYGSKRALTYLKTHSGFERLALHSMSLTIRTPENPRPVTIKSIAIPDAIQKLFEEDCLV